MLAPAFEPTVYARRRDLPDVHGLRCAPTIRHGTLGDGRPVLLPVASVSLSGVVTK